MLVVHKIIDGLLNALAGRRGKHNIHPIPGLKKPVVQETIALLRQAQNFDFGELVFEQNTNGTWRLPVLTEEELGFWTAGYIPLPYPVCWFEWVLGGSRSGLLVRELNDTQWQVQRIDFVRDLGTGDIIYTGLHVTLDRHTAETEYYYGAIGGDPEVLEFVKDIPYLRFNNIELGGPLALYLTLMLSSKTTEVRQAKLSTVQAVLDRAKNRTPMPAHRTVVIVPQRYQYTTDSSGRKHRSPRLHWRRSHLRVIHRGMPNEKKIVIARMLVGKAELGEVSHDYRVELPEPKA